MSRNKRKKKINKKKVIICSVILLLLIVGILIIFYKINYDQLEKENKEKLTKDIMNHYNEYVITNKDTKIYRLENKKYLDAGIISANQELTLNTKKITYEDEYLKINTFDEEYYVYYQDLDVIEELSENNNQRYKKYLVFNKNVVTKNKTNFYDEDGNLIYSFNKSFDLPIIINQKNMYGVEFNNQLLYVKDEDISKVKDNQNTSDTNTSGIAVLNYHFFYDDTKAGESTKCNQIICLSTTNLKKHLDYIKNNNIFTPTMKELEMYIDGYIQLPKSVVLTIDDGWRADIGSNIMAEYGLNGTVFLISNDYDPNSYQNNFIEVHSHGNNLHNPGVCSGGQGGAIKCLEKAKLLEDLSNSRKKLNNTTVFCYPFYEYNDYSIQVLKEAGFTMAFGGYGEGGVYRITPGINKFKLPRYVIYNTTSVNDLKKYIG